MKSSLLSLAFRSMVFTVLQPGIVAGLVPYFIDCREVRRWG